MDTLTQKELEAAINLVGRKQVFARAAALGWLDHPPPEAIWWRIVEEMK